MSLKPFYIHVQVSSTFWKKKKLDQTNLENGQTKILVFSNWLCRPCKVFNVIKFRKLLTIALSRPEQWLKFKESLTLVKAYRLKCITRRCVHDQAMKMQLFLFFYSFKICLDSTFKIQKTCEIKENPSCSY